MREEGPCPVRSLVPRPAWRMDRGIGTDKRKGGIHGVRREHRYLFLIAALPREQIMNEGNAAWTVAEKSYFFSEISFQNYKNKRKEEKRKITHFRRVLPATFGNSHRWPLGLDKQNCFPSGEKYPEFILRFSTYWAWRSKQRYSENVWPAVPGKLDRPSLQ